MQTNRQGPETRLLYSRKQVAQLLGGVSVATVRRLEQRGLLKGLRLTKSRLGTVFFRAADIDVFLKEASDAWTCPHNTFH
jgi:hypothetical protein